MSYHTLQRIIVRMLFDPAFVEQVYENPAGALAGLDLTETEQAQLLRTDRRAWGYDQLRRRRALRTLADEFKSSVTLVLSETRLLAALEGFFSSPSFHDSVQTRGSMGLAFSAFLAEGIRQGRLTVPQLPDVLRLETVMASCRRELLKAELAKTRSIPESIGDETVVQLAPAVAVASFQANTVATIQAIEKYLFEVSLMPAMVLCDDAPRLTNLPPVEEKKKVFMQFQPGGSGINLVQIEKDEYLVLFELKKPKTIHQLIGRAKTSGVTVKRATQILSEGIENRLIQVLH